MSTESTSPEPNHEARDQMIARLAAKRTEYREKFERTSEQLKLATDRIAALEAEVGGLRTKADTSASARRVAELEQQIREIGHRKVFDGIAAKAGARSDALDDLWQLSGYKADGEPDEAAIGALVEEQKGKRAYLFGEVKQEPGKPAPKPGPASGQGTRDGAVSPYSLDMDDARLDDAKWQFENFDRLAEAAKQRLDRGQI